MKALPLKRFAPLALLLAGLVGFFAFFDGALSFRALEQHRDWLVRQVETHMVLAAGSFAGLYALVAALSIPVAALLTITGGFLFGVVSGTALAVIGATIGSTIPFLAARYVFHDALHRRAKPWLRRMEAGFRANGLSYMLFLRLMPLFPFWAINLVAAFLGVRFATYVLATLIGIIPVTAIYASFGNSLDTFLVAGTEPGFGILLRADVLLPLLGLTILALAPIVYKKVMTAKRRGDGHEACSR